MTNYLEILKFKLNQSTMSFETWVHKGAHYENTIWYNLYKKKFKYVVKPFNSPHPLTWKFLWECFQEIIRGKDLYTKILRINQITYI